jgi:site-specific recombinase XerD
MCKALEGFFADHPRVKRPEQIQITDSEDWRISKLDSGVAWNVVRKDLCAVKAFYSWLRREHEDYSSLDNPIYVPPPAPKKKTLSIA